MRKLLFITAISSFFTSNSQISITSNIPSNVSVGSNIDVDVKIEKGGIGNFAKYQMDVPEGYSVFSTDNKGGNFTFDQQRAKIVWVSVPSEAEFTIKFKFLVNSSAPASGSISQKFFYLENNEKREYEATPITISTGGGAVASSNSNNSGNNSTSTPVETVKSTPVETVKSTPVETVKSTPVETVKSTPVETVKTSNTESNSNSSASKNNVSSSSSSSEAGMTFKVQLGAFSTQPSKSKYAAAGNINVEFIDGLYKVTSGNFNSRDEAIRHKDNLQNKGYSGFIVKYKDGKRVN